MLKYLYQFNKKTNYFSLIKKINTSKSRHKSSQKYLNTYEQISD